MKTIAWTMTPDIAMEFFKRCYARKAKTVEERTEILIGLAREGQMTSVVASKKTKEEFIKDKAKNFNVLKIGKKSK